MLRTFGSILLSATVVAVVGVAALGDAARATPETRTVQAGAGAATTVTPAVADIDALLAADQPGGRADRATARGELRRLGAWKKLIHATVVVDLPEAGPTTFQVDHGTISAVDATSLTIREAGGASVTVKMGGDTRVRRGGKKVAPGDLKIGDELFVLSKVETSATTAYLVVVPRR